MKFITPVLIIAALLTTLIIFEMSPDVVHDRVIVPEKIYVGTTCSCDCILKNRPWYSTFNYWFWFGILIVPAIILPMKPETSKWHKAAAMLIATIICYGAINMALHLMWDIRNGPFITSSDQTAPDLKTWNMADCATVSDGASLTFALLLGWIPAILYVGLMLSVKALYLKLTAQHLEQQRSP